VVSMESLRFVDLFAGAGGFSLGLWKAGMRGLFAVEKDPAAFTTLRYNLMDREQAFDWPTWLPKAPIDISSLLSGYRDRLLALRGKVDVVAGGPPCQGFSLAGRRDAHDERNRLSNEYVKFVEAVRPRFMIFENVPGFALALNGSGASHLELLRRQLSTKGFEGPAYRLVDFSTLGIPQSRRRLIVLSGEKGSDPEGVLERLISGQHDSRVTAAEALSDLLRNHGEKPCPDSPRFTAGLYGPMRSEYQSVMRAGECGAVPDSHRFARHHAEVVRRFATAIRLKGGQESRPLRVPSGTKKMVVRVLAARAPAPTLTTLPDDVIHYSEPRILTVREYARLQSFPDCFKFQGKYTTGGQRRRVEVPRYSQVANAVPPRAAELAGREIIRSL